MPNIKIVSCNDANKWYADLVGELLPLIRIEQDEYASIEPDGYINFVSKDDAEVM